MSAPDGVLDSGPMRSSALTVRLIVPVALVVLVGSLAALQYRWLGQVSEADRARMQTSLHQRAEELAADFDGELLRVYLAFQADRDVLSGSANTGFPSRYDAWRQSAKYPDFIRTFYVIDGTGTSATLREYQPATRTFTPVAWPDALRPVRDQIPDMQPRPLPGGRGQMVLTLRSPLVPSVPALLIPTPTVAPGPDRPGGMPSGALHAGFVLAVLDREYLEESLLPALAARYFPERDTDRYRLAVVAPSDVAHPIYQRDVPQGVTLDPAHADAVVPLFSLRPDLASQVVALRALSWTRDVHVSGETGPRADARPADRGDAAASVSIFLQSPSQTGPVEFAAAGKVPAVAGESVPAGVWQLVLQHPAGSLDAAVAEARRKNLWLSFGMLAVLAAGVGLVVVNAQRSQRLAAQQMDFVATVSHELRTPLTVIRSAAQNLSAGVVHDASQARQYGDLIETEGRRLTGMVEQVLEYAGLSGNRRLPMAQPVDPGVLVRDEAAACAPLCAASDVELAVDVADDLPPVVADPDAIRRAIHNLVANAVKYAGDGRWIGLGVRRSRARGRDEVAISVSDRGRGIDAEELPHVFEPFYRGRYALERQIHGNGLGLSLVRRIALAHGGRVTVRSAPGEGATFTLHLPAAAPDEAADRLPVAAPDAGGRVS
jgi:signal transduction histidine kinase